MLQERLVPRCQVAPHSRVRHAAEWRDDQERQTYGRSHGATMRRRSCCFVHLRVSGAAPDWRRAGLRSLSSKRIPSTLLSGDSVRQPMVTRSPSCNGAPGQARAVQVVRGNA